MRTVKGVAAMTAGAPLETWEVPRREVGDADVEIKILWAGICHSDIHTNKGEWPGVVFPCVTGHEIIGKVSAVGSKVTKFKVGDTAGVGCLVDSCRSCGPCSKHLEQFCEKGGSFTYNSTLQDKTTRTYGGYSQLIVVDEAFTLKISDKFTEAQLPAVAPLLCAGITTYSPLKHWNVTKGTKLAVNGLGGLGHMAVKLGHALGAHVTMISTSKSKEADSKALGADSFVLSSDADAMAKFRGHFDVIIDTVSATHSIDALVGLLKIDGQIVIVGAPPTPHSVHGTGLIFGRKSIAGSLIGGIKETQEMLDFCAEHGITSDIEIIKASEVNQAYERVLKSDVKYRFVIDASTI